MIELPRGTAKSPDLSRVDVYWLASLLAGIAAVLVHSLDLRRFTFSAPFSYTGDSLQYLAVFRTVLTTGWYFEPELLGAPFGAMHYDTPVPDGLFLLFVSLLRPFTDNPAIAFNLLFLGGFLLVPAAFFYAARRLEAPAPLAAAGALAYTFLPFHFQRLDHLFYTLYFVPPLVIACAATLVDAALPPVAKWLTWRKALLFVVAGAAGVYNAYFLMLTLAFAGAAGAFAWREPRRIVHGLLGCAVIAAALIANLVPNMVHQARFGRNVEVAQRSPGETERYGLKMAQMVLPNHAHPVSGVGVPAQKYNQVAPLVNENATASLGAVGAVGFLLSIVILLLRHRQALDTLGRRIDVLAKVNAFLFLVATVGGFGMIFSLLVSPQIRALNRSSVVIGAGALLVLLLCITRWADAASVERVRRRRIAIAGALLLLVWAIDEAPQQRIQPQQAVVEFRLDAQFVSAISREVPQGAMILQLPYTDYPERVPHFKEGHYGMFRPYLQPSSLKWSYGAMRGRDADLWLRALSKLPLAEQVDIARRSGFSGIYVERRAYADYGADVERQIAAVLGPTSVQRADRATAFYRMSPTGNTPVELLPPVRLVDGFYGWDRVGSSNWAWSRGNAIISISNLKATAVPVVVELKLQTLAPRSVTLSADGAAPRTIPLVPGQAATVRVPLTLAPGVTRLDFKTAEPAVAPGTNDPRLMTFAIIDPRLDTDQPGVPAPGR